MKKRILLMLCFAFGLILTIPSLGGLQAAQLWNKSSQEDRPAPKAKSYFNGSGTSGKIYNKNASISRESMPAGIVSAIKNYSTIRMSAQTDSKLWKLMGSTKVKNRQSDIDRALQTEYKTRINTSKHMINVMKSDARIREQNARAHEQRLATYHAEKAANKNQRRQSLVSNNAVTTPRLATQQSVTPQTKRPEEQRSLLKKIPQLFNSSK